MIWNTQNMISVSGRVISAHEKVISTIENVISTSSLIHWKNNLDQRICDHNQQNVIFAREKVSIAS